MQELSVEAEALPLIAVQRVPDHGVRKIPGVYPDLVRAPRFQREPRQRVLCKPLFRKKFRFEGTLVNALLFRLDSLSGINGKIRPGIVHRIDGAADKQPPLFRQLFYRRARVAG